MITYDEIKAAGKKLEREYAEEICPMIEDFMKTFNSLFRPYVNPQNISLAKTYGKGDLVKIPSFAGLGTSNIGKAFDPRKSWVPTDLYGLLYWTESGLHTSGDLWDYMICGRVSFPPVSDMITWLRKYKGILDVIRVEYHAFLEKLPSLAAQVESNLNILRGMEIAQEAEFHALFGDSKPAAKRIRVTLTIEEV